jgi:hypothetical protein
VVSSADVRPAVWLGVGLALVTLVIVAFLHVTRPR